MSAGRGAGRMPRHEAVARIGSVRAHAISSSECFLVLGWRRVRAAVRCFYLLDTGWASLRIGEGYLPCLTLANLGLEETVCRLSENNSVPLSVVVITPVDSPRLIDALRSGEPQVGQVLSVDSLAEGLRLVRETDVDVALVDVSLMRDDGPAAWQGLRAAAPGVPLIALVDPGAPGAAAFAAETGIVDVLHVDDLSRPRVNWILAKAVERHRLEQHVAFLVGLFERLEDTATLDEALAVALEEVCQYAGWILAEAWMPVVGSSQLHMSHMWSAGGQAADRFVRASRGMRFEPGEGVPGRVWETGRPQTLIDLTDPQQFVRSEEARKAGIRSGVAVPVLAGDRVIAVMLFFMGDHRSLDEGAVLLAKGLARQLNSLAGRQGERQRLEARLAELEREARTHRQVLDSVLEHVYMYDSGMRYLYASPSGARALGMDPEHIVGRTWRELGFPAEVMERFESDVMHVFETGRPLRGDLEFPVISGVGRFEYLVAPVRSAQGRVTAVVCTVRDQTHMSSQRSGPPRD